MKLYEVLAIEGTLRDKMADTRRVALNLFDDASKFLGIVTKSQTLDESVPALQDERREVPHTVSDIIAQVSEAFINYANASTSKEMANTKAFADVVLDGKTWASNLSATALLNLEGKLNELEGILNEIPTLERGETWEFNSETGLYVSSMKEQIRTMKVQRPITLSEATDKFPAQTQLVTVDVPAYAIRKTVYSGSVPEAEKRDALRRLSKLQTAVKQARQRANDVDIDKSDIGDAISNYVFGAFL